MCALYAFLRRTDDLADGAGAMERKAESLGGWRSALDSALAGHDEAWPGWPALADTVRRREIPARYLHEVIDGVEMDLDPRPFETFDDLAAYCHRVASVVGVSCLHILGYPGFRSDMSSPAARAVIAAASSAAGRPVAVLPMMGASVPIYLFDAAFHVPVIGFPIGNHDNNQHAANENIRLQNLWDGIAVYAAMMGELKW